MTTTIKAVDNVMIKPIAKTIQQDWLCERCGVRNKILRTLKRLFEYAFVHKCKCGRLKVLISNS